ncbi:MAG: DUF3971 domain-containing protein [Gammaproteobacteria bacterium]
MSARKPDEPVERSRSGLSSISKENRPTTMRWITRIAVSLLVLTALSTSLMRFVLPAWIEQHREELINRLGELAGQPIEADSLSVAWRGDGPAIVMRNLRLYDKERTRANLQADRVTLRFSLLELIRYRNLTPDEIRVAGIHLVLIRHEDGSLSIHGLEQQEDRDASSGVREADMAPISPLLLQPDYLRLSDARVTLVDLGSNARPLHLSPVTVDIDKQGDRHKMAASLSVEKGQQGEMMLIADLALSSEDNLLFWSGDIYLRTSGLNLAWLLENRIPGHYDLESARANMEAWSHWDAGRLQRLEGRLLTSNVRFRSVRVTEAPTLQLDSLGGHFRWLREDSGWRLDIDQPSISDGLRPWPTRAVSIALRRFPGEQAVPELFIGADELDIEAFMHALSVHPPKSALVDHLLKSGLRGQLKRPLLHLRMHRPLEWEFSGTFDNLSAYGTYRVPELENYSVEVTARNDSGRLRFRTENASVYARELFRWPIPVTRFHGDVAWQRVDEGHWFVRSDSLALENEHVRTSTAFGLHLESGKPPWLDLKSDFHDADGAYAPIYYPASIMPKESLNWLDNAIKHGKVVSGTARILGELVPEMFTSTGRGLFEVVAEIEDARLKYHPEWPAIRDVSGRLRFLGNTLTVEADTGWIYDNPVRDVVTAMTLKPLSAVRVKGTTEGDLAGPVRILTETPLGKTFVPVFEALEVKGEGRVEVDVDIPIKPEHTLRLDGRIEIRDTSVLARQAGIRLDNVAGELRVTERGIAAKELHAEFSGMPMRLAITPQENQTLVSSSLRMSDEMLMDLAGSSELPLSGEALWNLDLVIPTLGRMSRGDMTLTATSDLEGMALRLPFSLAKPAGSRRAVKVIWRPGEPQYIGIDYGGVKLQTSDNGRHLAGSIDIPELQGRVRYPLVADEALQLDLERLAVNFEIGEESGAISNLRPFDIPPMSITARQFFINDGDFGRMRMTSRHTPKGHEITELATKGALASFVATGIWKSRGGSSIDGILKSEQLGESLRKLAVTNQLTEANGNIEVSLAWDGGLLDFSLQEANGVIHVSTDEGRIASADPGFGRILGLVNISALKRRIKLDFSDFSNEGFVFDDMSGTLKLAHGVASTENLTIKAPSADIFISGEIDLGTRKVNQMIRVVPDLHGALPLAATAAGGPVAGAAALVIGKIAGKQLDRVAEMRYSVTGTWEEPVIERIRQPAVTDDDDDRNDPLSDFQ